MRQPNNVVLNLLRLHNDQISRSNSSINQENQETL
jgi:hypothetical protein